MLITNGRVVTFGEANEIIENGAVRVNGGRISDVGQSQHLEQAYPDEEVVDAVVDVGDLDAHARFRDEVLAPDARVRDLLDRRCIEANLAEQRAGTADRSNALWAVWMLELWLRRRKPGSVQ